MPKYLVSATYNADGLAGLQKDTASGRQKMIKKAIKGLGGKLEAFYFCFGSDDAIVIADLPDNVSAAAINLAASSSGLVTTRTTVLLTVDEVDQALAMGTSYRAPGA